MMEGLHIYYETSQPGVAPPRDATRRHTISYQVLTFFLDKDYKKVRFVNAEKVYLRVRGVG